MTDEQLNTIRRKYRTDDGHYYCGKCPIFTYCGTFCNDLDKENPNVDPAICERNIGLFEYPKLVLRGTEKTVTSPVFSDTEDMVNHPAHYTSGGIECIDAIYAALCKYDDPIDAWLAGQVIKYVWRAPLKGKYKEDIRKAKFYLDRLEVRQDEC